MSTGSLPRWASGKTYRFNRAFDAPWTLAAAYLLGSDAGHTTSFLTPLCRYAALGLAPGCDDSQVRKAYYRLAKECHPDLHPKDEVKAERFKALAAAAASILHPVLPQGV